MKAVNLALALLLVGTSVVLVAPAADAFGKCTFLDRDPYCPGIACIGTSWSYGDRYYRCQYMVPWPCQYCMPMANLGGDDNTASLVLP